MLPKCSCHHSTSFHSIWVITLSQGGPPKLVNSWLRCWTPSAHLANRSPVTTAVNIPSATCCTSQLMASSYFSAIIRLLWQKWRRWWSNKRVNLDRTNQPCNLLGWFLHCLAHHPGTFSIVWPLTELLFFSLVSPRDPKWDIDILARPVLGLAFDAPECSA